MLGNVYRFNISSLQYHDKLNIVKLYKDSRQPISLEKEYKGPRETLKQYNQ